MPALDTALLRASWRSWISSDLERVGPNWLQWVWTLVFSVVLAAVFTVAGYLIFYRGPGLGRAEIWLAWYGRNFVVCLTIAALIHLMFEGLGKLVGGPPAIRRWPDWKRSLFFGGVPLLGVVIGWPLGAVLVLGEPTLAFFLDNPRALAVSVTIALGISLALHFYFAARSRELHAERRATEAQLRLLQAQIEPHFLFNTLANVAALIDHEPAKAKSTLGAFTDYLRASLGQLRRDEVTLADELALAEAYLRVQGARMEDRLRYTIDAGDEARRAPLLPLLLQPLVENAVLHGVEPALDGGQVRVAARIEGQALVIEVQDDGPGPAAAPRRPPAGAARGGNGVALANIRERLLQRHGSAATLEVLPAHPGTLARLRLPLDPTTPPPTPR
ncbi:MAG: histidine kinase [Rubrivivax sp.]|nr:histidine kinase [Rubrivivax sp.]